MYRKAVRAYVNKLGQNQAMANFIASGMSSTTADRLVKGIYMSEPRGRIHNILKAELFKEGITLPGEPYRKPA